MRLSIRNWQLSSVQLLRIWLRSDLEKIKEREVSQASCLATVRLVTASFSQPISLLYLTFGTNGSSDVDRVSIIGERRLFLPLDSQE